MAWPQEIGPRYDAGIASPSYRTPGFTIKEGTYSKALQGPVRDEVSASVAQTLVDRDFSFWKGQTQSDWSQGEGQDVFTTPSRYRLSRYLDVHTPGSLSLLPLPVTNQTGANPRNGHGGVVGRNSGGGVEVVFPGNNGGVGTDPHYANPPGKPPGFVVLPAPNRPANRVLTQAG